MGIRYEEGCLAYSVLFGVWESQEVAVEVYFTTLESQTLGVFQS